MILPPFLNVIFLTWPVVAGIVHRAFSVTVQHVWGNVDRGHAAIQLRPSYNSADIDLCIMSYRVSLVVTEACLQVIAGVVVLLRGLTDALGGVKVPIGITPQLP